MLAMFATIVKSYRALMATGLMLFAVSMAQAQQDATAPAAAPVQGKLYTIAVGKMAVAPALKKAAEAAGKQLSLERLAGMMDGQMIDGFQNSRKFKVLSRSDLPDLIQEQGVHGVCKLVGATHLLILGIDDFQDSSESKTVAGTGTLTTRTVRILPVVKIYDSIENQALAVASMPVEFKIASVTPEGVPRDGAADDKVISVLAQATSSRLVNRVLDVLYPPKVVTRNDKEVSINRGDTTGIQVGQTWQVRSPDVIENDPDTNAPISIPGHVIGTIKVDEIKPTISLGTVTEETVAGQIIKGSSLSLAKNENKRYVHLIVDEKLAVTVIPETQEAAAPALATAQEGASAAKGRMTVGVFSFKVPAAIRAVVVKANREASLDYVLAQLDSQLTHRLQETGKYNLVTFTDLADIAAAQHIQLTGDYDPDKVAALFKKKGAKFIFVTTIDDFSDAMSYTHLAIRKQTVIDGAASISVVAKLLNMETAEIVDTVAVKRQVSPPTPIVVDDITVNDGGGGNSLLLQLSDQVSGEMAAGISSRMYPIKIIDRTGNEITVNVGSPVLLPGQIWTVRAPGKQKVDPDSGQMITIQGPEIGRVRIIEGGKSSATGQVMAETNPNAIGEGSTLRQLLPPDAPLPVAPPAPSH